MNESIQASQFNFNSPPKFFGDFGIGRWVIMVELAGGAPVSKSLESPLPDQPDQPKSGRKQSNNWSAIHNLARYPIGFCQHGKAVPRLAVLQDLAVRFAFRNPLCDLRPKSGGFFTLVSVDRFTIAAGSQKRILQVGDPAALLGLGVDAPDH